MSQALGLDFGTTNSAAAVARRDGTVRLAPFRQHGEELEVCRSILFFERDEENRRPRAWAGPAAIERYLAAAGQGRLMQSLKSFLSSRNMSSTSVFGVEYTLEQLTAYILRQLREKVEAEFGPYRAPVVVGRPVRFAWSESAEDDAIAEDRLRTSLGLAGFPDVRFEYEPVGAAYHYETSLDHDELVMVADFGGGTSDFCVLRLGPSFRHQADDSNRILATDGVGVGGDCFDSRIVRELVSPHLGREAHHQSTLGKVLPIPSWIYTHLSRWHQLSILKSARNRELLRRLRGQAVRPDQIESLIALIEQDLGYALYMSVESSKVGISDALEADFRFCRAPIDIVESLQQSSFEAWISEELRAVADCVDRTLDAAGVGPSDVDRVFLTGGSARVPAVRRILREKFGNHRMARSDDLVSVASGLAQRACAISY